MPHRIMVPAGISDWEAIVAGSMLLSQRLPVADATTLAVVRFRTPAGRHYTTGPLSLGACEILAGLLARAGAEFHGAGVGVVPLAGR